MTDETLVIYKADGHVATLTLNRPGAMNAFDQGLRTALGEAMAQAEADETIRVVILTGAGRAFSAGTDVRELTEDLGMDADISISHYKPLIDHIANSDKIYIAAINGFAGGVALGLALGADLAAMSDTAKIFSPFANIGLVPDGGATWFYLHHLGYKRAFQAMIECEQLDAQFCLDAGMVNKVMAPEDLQAYTLSWAQSLAARSPLSLKFTKKIMRQAGTMSRENAARLESEYQTMAINSEDARGAVKAFLNKEKPTFKGR